MARGKYKEADVEAVHDRISELIKATSGSTIVVDKYYYCPYHPKGKVKKYRRDHPFRKPNPGMLLQASKDLNIDLGRSWMIGDQHRDVQAANAAGVRAILLCPEDDHLTMHQEEDRLELSSSGPASDGDMPDSPHYFVAPTLIEAVKIIAQQGRFEADPVITMSSRKRRRNGVLPARSRATEREKPSEEPLAPVVTKTTTVADSSVSVPSRPFRPWAIQPSEDDRMSEELSVEVVDPSPEPGSRQRDELRSSEVTSADQDQLLSVSSDADSTDTSESPMVDKATLPDVPNMDLEHILRQILQELRNHRSADTDFSFHIMMAIVLQMVAAVCLLAALWMGGGHLEQFIRWTGVGLIVQLATISMLLFRR